MATKRATAGKGMTLDQVMARHGDVTLRIALVEAALELMTEHFAHHDGLEPRSIVLTNDGRRVPEATVSLVIDEMRATLLDPLNKELEKLRKVKI
jgi:DNA-binding transcriptional regulator YbjK